MFFKKRKSVSDISCRSAELFDGCADRESYAYRVQFVRKKVVTELPREIHDAVIGKRTRYEYAIHFMRLPRVLRYDERGASPALSKIRTTPLSASTSTRSPSWRTWVAILVTTTQGIFSSLETIAA